MFHHHLTMLITDAGDSGVLLPMSIVGIAMIWIFHSGRLAWLLARSVLFASIVIALLKLLFLSCGAHWQLGLISPSGHACLSAVVYGSLGTIFAAGRPAWQRVAINVMAALVVAAIALTRIKLGVHTWPEVLVGVAVGVVAHLWFARSYARMQPLQVDAKTFGVALTATMLIAFGVRLPAESFLRHLARHVGENCQIAYEQPGSPADSSVDSRIAHAFSSLARAVPAALAQEPPEHQP